MFYFLQYNKILLCETTVNPRGPNWCVLGAVIWWWYVSNCIFTNYQGFSIWLTALRQVTFMCRGAQHFSMFQPRFVLSETVLWFAGASYGHLLHIWVPLAYDWEGDIYMGQTCHAYHTNMCNVHSKMREGHVNDFAFHWPTVGCLKFYRLQFEQKTLWQLRYKQLPNNRMSACKVSGYWILKKNFEQWCGMRTVIHRIPVRSHVEIILLFGYASTNPIISFHHIYRHRCPGIQLS